MSISTRTVSADPTGLGAPAAIGRGICGAAGDGADRAAALLERSLGPGGAVLGAPAGSIALDFDTCWLGDEPLVDLASWRDVIARDRLGDVRGAFAVAWRDADGSLRLARDPIGERTLYWVVTPGGILFASSVAALLESGLVERRIDLGGLARYLSYAYVPGPRTLVRGVSALEAGETMRFRDGRVSRGRLWELPAEPLHTDVDEDALRRKLRATLERAVDRRVPAEAPIAATLSGGVDSSLVVALLARRVREPVHTFSISFGAGYRNELDWSRLVAQHCAAHHTVVAVPPEAIVRHLDATIATLGAPIGDPLTVPNALLFHEAARHARVVFNGEGGDPCFGGPKNLPMLASALYTDLYDDPDPLARERAYLDAHKKCSGDVETMLDPAVRAALPADEVAAELVPWFEDARWPSLVNRLMAINVSKKGAHHILAKLDEISRPHGVFPRSPLFDQDVVDAAFAIPPQMKLRGTVEKYLLKEAVRDLLPSEIILRPKSGMLVPVEAWFRGPLREFARERLLDGLASTRLFERAWLERLVGGRLREPRPRRGAKIWLLLTLEAWLRAARVTL